MFVNQSGNPLTEGAFDQALQEFINGAIESGAITPEQKFTPHCLMHRGITHTKGNKPQKQLASGHKTAQMVEKYGHKLTVVDPATAPEL